MCQKKSGFFVCRYILMWFTYLQSFAKKYILFWTKKNHKFVYLKRKKKLRFWSHTQSFLFKSWMVLCLMILGSYWHVYVPIYSFFWNFEISKYGFWFFFKGSAPIALFRCYLPISPQFRTKERIEPCNACSGISGHKQTESGIRSS